MLQERRKSQKRIVKWEKLERRRRLRLNQRVHQGDCSKMKTQVQFSDDALGTGINLRTTSSTNNCPALGDYRQRQTQTRSFQSNGAAPYIAFIPVMADLIQSREIFLKHPVSMGIFFPAFCGYCMMSAKEREETEEIVIQVPSAISSADQLQVLFGSVAAISLSVVFYQPENRSRSHHISFASGILLLHWKLLGRLVKRVIDMGRAAFSFCKGIISKKNCRICTSIRKLRKVKSSTSLKLSIKAETGRNPGDKLSIGGLITDEQGKFECFSGCSIEQGHDNLYGETLAIHSGLSYLRQLAGDKRISVTVETESEESIAVIRNPDINKGSYHPRTEHMLAEIRQYLSATIDHELILLNEGNECACFMAKIGASMPEDDGLMFYETMPRHSKDFAITIF